MKISENFIENASNFPLVLPLYSTLTVLTRTGDLHTNILALHYDGLVPFRLYTPQFAYP